MDETEPQGDLPAEHVTVDQIVAWNIRHHRRKAGMTQEQLGDLLGWTAANVSAAERSADPARERRRFDAQTLTELSIALSVPLIALFLPPEDDGIRATYTFTGPRIKDEERGRQDGVYDMRDLMALVVIQDSDDDAPVMEAYRYRLLTATGRYMDAPWHDDMASILRPIEPAELLAVRIGRLRAYADEAEAAIAGAAQEYRAMADALQDALDREAANAGG